MHKITVKLLNACEYCIAFRTFNTPFLLKQPAFNTQNEDFYIKFSFISKIFFPFFIEQIISFFSHININTKWKQYGLTIAGGNGKGNQLNQLSDPRGIYVADDNDQCIYIADCGNDRIVARKYNTEFGQVVAGGN